MTQTKRREKNREGKKEIDRKSLGVGLWKQAVVGGAGTFASAQGSSTLVFTCVSRHISQWSVSMANKQRQPSKHAHACARSHGDMLAKGSLVDLFSLVSYIVYSTRV